MNRTAYLAVACDADWGLNPTCRTLPNPAALDDVWDRLLASIPLFRQQLDHSRFVSQYGPLPVTWLLRADRQVAELYGDAAFCARKFEPAWKDEQSYSSELGWHPHLYRWHDQTNRWRPGLGQDDDLEILAQSLEALRRFADVRAVRTGWAYQSNSLFAFFARAGLLVDASGIPGSFEPGPQFHDWRGAPRVPYFPSCGDYRRPADSPASALPILEMPVLARTLPAHLHLARYSLRLVRGARSSARPLPDWQSARWQGVLLSRHRGAFADAVRQTLAECSSRPAIFLTTYFHLRELAFPAPRETLLRNLEAIDALTQRFGCTLEPTTLSAVAARARQELLTVQTAARLPAPP
ncbi:MAG: hypothetical protein HYY26_02360 [Acidobacteria bacterium]|nr:hypothetical protein [Acidobacteriota bacterium]